MFSLGLLRYVGRTIIHYYHSIITSIFFLTDWKTCNDLPCFPGVECEDAVLPDRNDVRLLLTLDIIVRYQCEACPFGYEGDGEVCNGKVVTS